MDDQTEDKENQEIFLKKIGEQSKENIITMANDMKIENMEQPKENNQEKVTEISTI